MLVKSGHIGRDSKFCKFLSPTSENFFFKKSFHAISKFFYSFYLNVAMTTTAEDVRPLQEVATFMTFT